MTIYIEYFLIQNLIINFCLIRLVYLTTKCETSFFRLILSSIVGAGFSVISAIFINNLLIMNLLKILCAFMIVIIAFNQSKKYFIINFILLFMYTYAVSGLINSISSHQIFTSLGIISYTNLNLNNICIFAVLISYIYEWIARCIKLRTKTNSYIYKTTLRHKDKQISINAYLDTGNLLNLDGRPIIIVDLDIYLKLTNTPLITYLATNTTKLTTNTITGTSNLKIFSIDEISIIVNKKTIKLTNQLIAVNNTNKFKNTNYQALLSPMVI